MNLRTYIESSRRCQRPNNIVTILERLKIIKETGKEIRRINSMIRFFFHEDPDILSDVDWAMRDAELTFMLEKTGKLSKNKKGQQTLVNK